MNKLFATLIATVFAAATVTPVFAADKSDNKTDGKTKSAEVKADKKGKGEAKKTDVKAEEKKAEKAK